MRLGLIGYPLGHSWSPEIHKYLIGADYELWEIKPEELEAFFAKKDFDGINVTIPYKQEVIPYLDEIDEGAKRIGAVNTIINKDGKLIGYNTDYLGLIRMMNTHQINPKEKEVAILGTGGASKAAVEAVKTLGGLPIQVSRHPEGEEISYQELYDRNFEYLINATPVGMFPNVDEIPIELEKLPSLKGIVDIISNPVRTLLVFEAEQKGITCCGGFEMLVSQALEADELFTGKQMDDDLVEKCIDALLKEKRNVVLIGMPSAGKSTIGQLLAEKTGMPLIEMDQEIVEEIGMPIADYFSEYGETAFRDLETLKAKEVGKSSGAIISTGGGVIKRKENIRQLAHNGLIIWIDRNVEFLIPTESRPLARNVSDIYELYAQRYPLYEKYSDIKLENNESIDVVMNNLLNIMGR